MVMTRIRAELERMGFTGHALCWALGGKWNSPSPMVVTARKHLLWNIRGNARQWILSSNDSGRTMQTSYNSAIASISPALLWKTMGGWRSSAFESLPEPLRTSWRTRWRHSVLGVCFTLGDRQPSSQTSRLL